MNDKICNKCLMVFNWVEDLAEHYIKNPTHRPKAAGKNRTHELGCTMDTDHKGPCANTTNTNGSKIWLENEHKPKQIAPYNSFWAEGSFECGSCYFNTDSYFKMEEHQIEVHGIAKEEPKVQYAGGATRTKKPRYALIPKTALDCLVARFELGEVKHGTQSWNALSPLYESALTKEWIIAGLEHVIGHAMNALAKINGKPYGNEETIFDDAGAIMFGGAVLASYTQMVGKKDDPKQTDQRTSD